MDDVADFAIFRCTPVNIFLRFLLLLGLQALLLLEILMCEAEVSPRQEVSFGLRVVATVVLIAACPRSPIVLQKVAQKHLVEVVIVVDVCIRTLVQVFHIATQDPIGVSFELCLFNEFCLAFFILHE